jgi:hypothetical protein|tara:strand:- start:64 stop:231 length:168 start_codon:yes stop_codon:yes gene_type:complete
MTPLERLQEFSLIDVSELSTEELFEVKKIMDKWYREALERVNTLGSVLEDTDLEK